MPKNSANTMVISKQAKKTAGKLLPIDDAMFEKMAENKESCEEVISTILDCPVVLKNFDRQKSIKNLENRSVRLDLIAILKKDCEYGSAGTVVTVEVQKSDNDDHMRRVRYNSSAVTTSTTPKNAKFKDVTEIIAIYISKFDIFEGGYNFYNVDRVVRQTGQSSATDSRVQNGLTEIYVNTLSDNRDERAKKITKLMSIFTKANVYDYELFPYTSERKYLFRNTKEGKQIMCEKVQQSFNEIERFHFYEYVEEGGMDISYAAKKAGQTEAEFKKDMRKNGFKIPANRAVVAGA